MPQVHGAVRDALAYAATALEIETGSATDNPLVFRGVEADTSDIISGGNFHGAPIGLAMDFAAIALTDLISIGERRVDRLVNPDVNEGLPPFLTREAGVSSGFMIAHVALAALLNECRVLAHPASADSTPTSGGKEDHVSMGMTSALKLRQIVANAEYALAIELIAAVEGIEYREPLRPSKPLRRVIDIVRKTVKPLTIDRVLATDIEAMAVQIRRGAFDEWLEVS
jgi:histidine ammonia-lyase